MKQKGQTGFVALFIILVLIILIVIAFGYFLNTNYFVTIESYSSGEMEDSGVLNSQGGAVMILPDCCLQNTFINSNPVVISSVKETRMNNYYYTKSCNDCNPKVWIGGVSPKGKVVSPPPLEGFYHANVCNDCSLKVWVGDVYEASEPRVMVLDGSFNTPNCCNC